MGVQGHEAAGELARGVEALRLNRHFPDRTVVSDYLKVLAQRADWAWDSRQGLPEGTAWLALDVARQEALRTQERWQHLGDQQLGTQGAEDLKRHQARVQTLAALPPLPRRTVSVKLRHRGERNASYLVVVDRFDLRTTTLARYTLVLEDVPGAHLSAGDLAIEAEAHFADALNLLDSQDAALAFAVLAERVTAVQEVVRGTIGPMFVAPVLGPAMLAETGASVVATASLERASVDLKEGRVDDALTRSVVWPTTGAFGVSRTRKYAAPAHEVPGLKAWLREHGSRSLVYGW